MTTFSELTVYMTERQVRMGKYWSSSLFTCLWTEPQARSIHTWKENETNISPYGPSARSINDLLYGYNLVTPLFLFDYKSKQSQEETSAVQCTCKYTTGGNSEWLTFSQAKNRLDGKLTAQSIPKNQISVWLLSWGCESSSEKKISELPRYTNSCRWI